ncbi:MAG: transcriptional regulator, XRE family [uncultured bacterium]|nr:MAG: transcriptional regulator, XRE family [uncultured bacterium]HBD05344.1 transcriptional regulator [Candidatus Uhrbacteria bacterium]
MKSFKQFKKAMLTDKAVRKAYDDLGPEFELIAAIIEKRLQKGLTQAELARKIGTKQSAIARLESGNYNPTVELLKKVAKALNARLEISIS